MDSSELVYTLKYSNAYLLKKKLITIILYFRYFKYNCNEFMFICSFQERRFFRQNGNYTRVLVER